MISKFRENNFLQIFDDVTIAAGDSAVSKQVDFDHFKPFGYVTLQLTTTSAGSAKLKAEMECTVNMVDWCLPNGAADIVAAHPVGTGLYMVATGMAVFGMRITATGSDADQVVNGWLLIQ